MALKKMHTSRALALMDQNWKGLSVNETVNELRRRYHPEASIYEVRKTYFPKGGSHAISHLEGRSHDVLLRKLHQLRAFAREASDRMRRRQQDPNFRKANADRMRSRYNDAGFMEAHVRRSSDRMRRLQNDSHFQELRRAGIRAYHERKRQEKVRASA